MQILSSRAQEAIQKGAKIRLNLGAGNTLRPGFLSVDIRYDLEPDIVANLNNGLPLIPNDSTIEIFSRHTLEHLDNLDILLSEFMRICVSGALITIVVPHFSNPYGYSDPTHKRFFGIYSFCYYSQNNFFQGDRQCPHYNSNIDFKIDKILMRFYRTSLIDRLLAPFLEKAINNSPSLLEIYERRVCFIWPAWEVEYQLSIP